jgi:outer membrane beta-barrel protein
MGPVRLLIALLLVGLVASSAAAECVDRELDDKMSFKRKRRGRVPRDFVKAQRHEISANGGYYVSDLFSGTYVVGGSYTYHMTEETAVEASFSFTHANADFVRAVEDGRVTVLEDVYAPIYFATAALLWYPLHGKLRMGGSIVHFDVSLLAGAGVVSSQTSRGVAGVGGMGFKLFAGKAVAFRLDVRDHVYREELLGEGFIVNDVALTAGFSLFLPLGF